MRKKMIRGPAVACAIALSVCAGTGFAADNIAINGGFESGMASWTTSGFLAEDYDYGIDSDAHSGANAFYGGGVLTPGYLIQVLTTQIGKTYDVDVWLASDGYLPNTFQVLADGNLLLSQADVMLQGYGVVGTQFTATATQTELKFGLRNDAGFFHIDDVTVAVVPEPGTYALLLLGVGAIVLKRRNLGKLH